MTLENTKVAQIPAASGIAPASSLELPTMHRIGAHDGPE
jgi:hypothetical protein